MDGPFEALLTEEFKVGSEDFADLEVRSSGTEGFRNFFHTKRNALIKHFRIYDGPQVVTLMSVALIKKDEKLQPRIRFWKRKTSS